jgi:acetyl-CoA carboxylase biotin carboxyl carrier protein
MEINLETIQSLVDLATEKHLSELTIENDDQKVTIKTAVGAIAPVATAQAVAPAPQKAPETVASPPVSAPPSANLYKVTSPMVGTFYRSPSPTSPPFADVGSQVSKGQTLCIIEAMKLMNELESEVSGVVRKILVEDGKPVEFGQVLLEIEVQSQ